MADFVQGLHVPRRRKQAVDPKTGEWQLEWLSLMATLGQTYGAWNVVGHASAVFSASGSMTFTVAEADLVTFEYGRMGKRLEVVFTIRNASVGGVVSDTLRIGIPGVNESGAAFVAARDMTTPVLIVDNGTRAIGLASVVAGGTVISITKVDGSNWTASANATGVEGSLAIEVR